MDTDALVDALADEFPREIVSALVDEYESIKRNFYLGRYGPSELDGGRMAECVLRLLEYITDGRFTDLSGDPSTNTVLGEVKKKTNLPDGVRKHIPRAVRLINNVRNNRDVAHVSDEIDPNHADSFLVVRTADWIMIELVRQYHGSGIDEAREIVDSLVEKEVPLVQELDGEPLVLNSELSFADETLVILYHKSPDPVSSQNLFEWTGYSDKYMYKKNVLSNLEDDRKIYIRNNYCNITQKGEVFVEENINLSVYF